jgi:hypothetical protein
MSKLVLAFIVFTALFWFGIEIFRKMSGKEKWKLTKVVTYSALCSILAISTLTLIVILF